MRLLRHIRRHIARRDRGHISDGGEFAIVLLNHDLSAEAHEGLAGIKEIGHIHSDPPSGDSGALHTRYSRSMRSVRVSTDSYTARRVSRRAEITKRPVVGTKTGGRPI